MPQYHWVFNARELVKYYDVYFKGIISLAYCVVILVTLSLYIIISGTSKHLKFRNQINNIYFAASKPIFLVNSLLKSSAPYVYRYNHINLISVHFSPYFKLFWNLLLRNKIKIA